MNKIGIIGSAGFLNFTNFEQTARTKVTTDFGEPSGDLVQGVLQGKEVVFLYRNNEDGSIPPHRINYRANIKALSDEGVRTIIAISPCNGIRADMVPGILVVPDQLIDYTHSRQHTFFENDFNASRHLDFRFPYNEVTREKLLHAAKTLNVPLSDSATYGVIQGPRLTTLAEINRLERDGCHIMGMTGMPETLLARELELNYACLAMITHKAAGRRATVRMTTETLAPVLKESLQNLHAVVEQLILDL